MVARRDLRDKQSVPFAGVADHVIQLLDTIQSDMLERARNYRDEQTRTAKSYDEFKQILASSGGFIWAHWNGSAEVEDQIKTETKATIRCIPFADNPEPGTCIVSGEPSTQEVLFGIAY
jgi:prolyl-tRNA synthetase